MDFHPTALKTRKYPSMSSTPFITHNNLVQTSDLQFVYHCRSPTDVDFLISENVNKKFGTLSHRTHKEKCQCGMSYKHLHPACNIKQPFKGLESWVVLTQILGYAGFKYDMHDILRQVSRKTRSYLWSHHRPLLDYSLTAAPAQRASQLKLSRQLKKTKATEKSHFAKTGFGFSAFADFEDMMDGVTMIFKLNDDAVFKVKKHKDDHYEVSFIPALVTDYRELRTMSDLTLRQSDSDEFVSQTIKATQLLESDSCMPKNFFIHRGFALAGFEGHTYVSTKQ